MIILARLTAQGTAAADTAVCFEHLALSRPSTYDDDPSVTEPVPASGNDELSCQICGRTERS